MVEVASLLGQAQSGDKQALEQLIRQFDRYVFGVALHQYVRDGVDDYWSYEHDYGQGANATPHVDKILLTPEQMANLAQWHVPSPFRSELDQFADILPNVELDGEAEIAGRWAYVMRGELQGLAADSMPDDLKLIPVQVTLYVDVETYWLLGRRDEVEGEEFPRLSFLTTKFDLLTAEQVPVTAFSFELPAGVTVRQHQGIEEFYALPSLPAVQLEAAADMADFALVMPTVWPADLQAPPHVLLDELDLNGGPELQFRSIYRGPSGRQMMLTQSRWPTVPGLGARLLEVGDQPAWLVSDFIDSRQFQIFFPNFDVAQSTAGDQKLPPGSLELRVWGLTVDEAVQVLESLAFVLP